MFHSTYSTKLHMLKKDPVSSFDEQRFQEDEVLNELRRRAKADNPDFIVPAFLLGLLLMFGAVIVERADFAEEWKMIIWLVMPGLFALALQTHRGNGQVSVNTLHEWRELRRNLDLEPTKRLAEKEAEIRLKIYEEMRRK